MTALSLFFTWKIHQCPKQDLWNITFPQFSHLQNVCASKTSWSHLWLLTEIGRVLEPNRWQVHGSARWWSEWVNRWSVWTAWLIRHLAQLCKPGSSQIAETTRNWRHSHPHAVRSRNCRQRAGRKRAASRQQQTLQIHLPHRWKHYSAHFKKIFPLL